MLKVVGASWEKTRISTYILVGMGLLVIATFFIAEMERPQYDGTYCATVYWAEKSGFHIEYWKQRVDLDNIPKGVARTCYKDSILENGWSQLEIETQRIYPDWVQATAAGLLEGSLTWKNIYNHWLNTIQSICDKDDYSQNFCTWLRDLLSENYLLIKEIGNKHRRHDHYWHQVRLFYYQLEGLEAGWRRGSKRARSGLDDIPFEDFLLLNAVGDLNDFRIHFNNFVLKQSLEENMGIDQASPTMLMKLNGNHTDGWQILFGHSSAGMYSEMLRIQKRYKFRFHLYPEKKSSTVPGMDIMFTGYPGILASTDDFYIIKGRQVNAIVAGIKMKYESKELWENINIKNVIPLTARVMVANRLAQSRRVWAKIMSRHPLTGNKQWLIVDLRRLDSLNLHSIIDSSQINTEILTTTKARKGAIWLSEQIPGRLHAQDITDYIIRNNTLWISNGIPFFSEIYKASGIRTENLYEHDNGEDSSHYLIKNLDDVEKYIKMKAFRGDLHGENFIPYGNIDTKLFSYLTKTGQSKFFAISGPPYMKIKETTLKPSHFIQEHDNNGNEWEKDTIENEFQSDDRRLVRDDIRALAIMQEQRPFEWSKVNENIEHEGHPDKWNFGRTSPKWAWHN